MSPLLLDEEVTFVFGTDCLIWRVFCGALNAVAYIQGRICVVSPHARARARAHTHTHTHTYTHTHNQHQGEAFIESIEPWISAGAVSACRALVIVQDVLHQIPAVQRLDHTRRAHPSQTSGLHRRSSKMCPELPPGTYTLPTNLRSLTYYHYLTNSQS